MVNNNISWKISSGIMRLKSVQYFNAALSNFKMTLRLKNKVTSILWCVYIWIYPSPLQITTRPESDPILEGISSATIRNTTLSTYTPHMLPYQMEDKI